MEESILSVGIDIGTSTTQVMFSTLTVQNAASFFAVPHIDIVEKTVVYAGEIYTTPLQTQHLIDGDAVRALVAQEYQRAGFTPNAVATGAVIITGESARKENARLVLAKLSDFAGEFVVSTAGPDLEAVIAGKGSGAWHHATQHTCPTANIDIGGGTSNIVLFDETGAVVAKGCVDIGGRQICISPGGSITYCSPSAQDIATALGIPLTVGQAANLGQLRAICDEMATLLFDLVAGKPSALGQQIITAGSTVYQPAGPAPALVFSGGVANHIHTRHQAEPFPYGDIGVLLGQAIRNHPRYADYTVLQGAETIRATVVGAGSYTTTLSGSTVFYSQPLFPLKNLPALALNHAQEAALQTAEGGDALAQQMAWFLQQHDTDQMLLVLQGVPKPTYPYLMQLATALAHAAQHTLAPDAPLLVCIQQDIAKALGQTVFRLLGGCRPVVVIDSVAVAEHDYVDMGCPLMQGLVIPIVVKTLIFGD